MQDAVTDMNKRVDQVLIYSPQDDNTPQELAEILRLVVFHTYPPELKTQENLTALFNKLPPNAQRHFQIQDP
jgi:hypothetical protein